MWSLTYSEKLSANLSGLCAPSLESRARCSWDAEPCQALRQAVGASTGERERPVPATILLSRWHQALLALSVSVALCLSAVFGVAAPLPPEAGTLLAAQMVQRRCPFGWALEQHTQVVTAQQCVCECVFFFFLFFFSSCAWCVYQWDQGEVFSDYCQVLLRALSHIWRVN